MGGGGFGACTTPASIKRVKYSFTSAHQVFLSLLSLFVYLCMYSTIKSTNDNAVKAKCNASTHIHLQQKKAKVERGNNFCNATRVYWSVIE